MSKYKLLLSGCAALVLAVIVTQHGEVLHVATAFAQQKQPNPWEDPMNAVTLVVSWIVMAMTVLGLICIRLVEFFLSPQLYSTIMSNGGALKDLWLLSRDVMNIIFAFMLLGMAFYTIVIGNAAKIKENITWFVLAVVLVNFSWFFPRVILDFANVLTATIFTIPGEISLNNQGCVVPLANGGTKPCEILTRVELNADPNDPVNGNIYRSCDNSSAQTPTGGGAQQNDGYCRCFKTSMMSTYPICWWTQPFNSQNLGSNSALISGLAVNYGRITSLPLVAKGNNAVANGQQVTLDFPFLMGLAFSLLFSIALVFPLLALCAGLMLRVIILWATVAFMPFSFIGFVINKGKLGTDVFGVPVNIWKEFLNAAFLPAIVAVPICIGFIMIMAGANMEPPPGAPFVFNMKFFGEVENYWQMLWSFAALMVIWIGAFSALKRSEIIGNITEKIRGTGAALGQAVAKLPLLTPLPVPGNENFRLGQLLKGPENLNAAISGMAMRGESWDDAKRRILGGAGGPVENKRIADAAKKIEAAKVGDLDAQLKTYSSATSTIEQKKEAMNKIKEILERDAGIEKSAFRNDEDVIETLKGLDEKLKEDPSKGSLSNTALTNAAKLQGPLKDVQVTNSTATTVNITNAKGETKAIDFGKPEYNVDNAAGRQRVLEDLGYGEMANTAQGIEKVKAALNAMTAASSNLDAATKGKINTIAGDLKPTELVEETFKKNRP